LLLTDRSALHNAATIQRVTSGPSTNSMRRISEGWWDKDIRLCPWRKVYEM